MMESCAVRYSTKFKLFTLLILASEMSILNPPKSLEIQTSCFALFFNTRTSYMQCPELNCSQLLDFNFYKI